MAITTKEALLAWRKAAGLSQAPAAELIGRSRLRYIHYEQGKARIPTEVSAKLTSVASTAPDDPFITLKTHPQLFEKCGKSHVKNNKHPARGFESGRPYYPGIPDRERFDYGPLVEWVETIDGEEKAMARVSSLEPENYKRHQEWVAEKTRGQAERNAAVRARMPAELQHLWDDVDD